ncbi:RHS repeat-associated core domain-containing protein [Streptomyces sp. NPDC053427]|uniref:RHS repeat-associated core domain-containing protein n=1 Tax=Streptomyces sp. NPDC053427 TaxID=3365701 RepID=UPI0037D3F7C7
MGVVLPGWADELLDLIGVSWPNVDEDDYREMANAMREFADDIDEGANEAHTAIQSLVGSAGGSMAVEALNAHWGKINGKHLKGLADCGRMAGTAMDGVAVLIEGAKIGALVQLGILAAEVIAAQAAAPFTLGLSELGAMGATQATRLILKRLFKEVCQQVAEQVVSIALTPVEEALGAMVGDLVVQLGANALGVQDGVDLGRTAKAGKDGFGQGVQDAKGAAKQGAANPAMGLLSAGGGGGGGGASGGGSGFSFDEGEHDNVVTGLQSASGTFRNKAGGKIGRAKGHHGRTRGKDAIADAANTVLDKVIDGIEDGVKKTAKHLDDNMTRGVKQMAKNHRDNDTGLADHFKGLGKDGKKDPKAPNGGGGLGTGRTAKDGRANSKSRDQLGRDHENNSTRTQDSVCSGGSDPVDMASGKMYLPQTDVTLAGRLPLSFSRRAESGYHIGRWFGPSWSSTADQRLEIDDDGIIFVTEAGLLLSYRWPTAGAPVLPEAGPRWPLELDDNGDYTVTDPATGLIRHFTPHDGGLALLDEISDRNGQWISFDYDKDGAPTDIRHGAGYHLKLTTADGRITALHLADAGPDGSDQLLKRYGYTDGHLTEVADSSGHATCFEYDEAGRIVSWTDSNDSRYDYFYDDQNRCIAQGGVDGHVGMRLTYDQTDPATGLRVTTATDSLGHTSRYLVNDALQVVAEIDPLGGVTRTERDRYDRALAITDPLGRVTRFDYDEAGNVVSAIRPDGLMTAAVYNHLSLPIEIIDPDGGTWRQTYDERGNRTSVTDPGNAATLYSYDSRGFLTGITNALGHTTFLENDPAGLPVTVSGPQGTITRYRRDSFGRVTAAIDALGNATELGWTVEGHLTSRIEADGTRESWTYDGEGNCVASIDAMGSLTRYEYTHFDLLAARTDPAGVRYEFTHDTNLRLISVTNPQGLEWKYEYDSAGRLISEKDFDGRALTYIRDVAGQIITRTNALGQQIDFRHDALGRVIEKTTPDARTAFSYDASGRLVQAISPDATLTLGRDELGRIVSETLNGRTLTNEYDALGRRKRRRTPTGVESTQVHDADGNLRKLVAAGHLIEFAHDMIGQEVSRAWGEGVKLSHAWDSSGHLTSQSLGVENHLVQNRTFTYRPDGHLVGVNDQLNGAREFELDVAGRITEVRAHNWKEEYAYDDAGNQASANWPARHPGSESRGMRVYNGTRIVGAGQIRYEHDAQGRVTVRQKTRISRKPDTWRFEWNAEDRLTAVSTPDGQRWRYFYDPLGRRIAKQKISEDGTVLEQIDFTWDRTNLAEQTTRSVGRSDALTVSWEHDGLQPIAQVERKAVCDTTQQEIDQRFFAIITDLVGTPTELADVTGNVVWRSRSTVWGSTTWTANSTGYTPLRFPGQYFDPETGLHYNFYRYYDPETARYASPDPIGLAPAPNPVTYVQNPHASIDPYGLAPKCRPKEGYTSAPFVESDPYSPESVEKRSAENNEYYGPSDADRARDLGYPKEVRPAKSAPFDNHGQRVFTNGKTYITRDIDGHNVSDGWKMFNRKGKRMGTYDPDLNYLKP